MKTLNLAAWLRTQLTKFLRFWKQLICRHTDTGIHSFPYSRRRAGKVLYAIYQRRVCLDCGKALDKGRLWRDDLSLNMMKRRMNQLRHEAQSFAIKRAVEQRRAQNSAQD